MFELHFGTVGEQLLLLGLHSKVTQFIIFFLVFCCIYLFYFLFIYMKMDH